MTERKLAVRVVSPGGGALGERIYELGPSTKRLAVLHHSGPLDLGWFEGISARLLKMGVDEVARP